MNGIAADVPQGQTLDRRKVILSATAVALSLAVLVFVVLKYTLWAETTAADASRNRAVVDSETGEVILSFRIPEKSAYPWKNPKTGRKTLYLPESCYWTKDGKAKLEPTYVILNLVLDKPGKTLCPDCGREVVVHNPMPPANLLQEAARAARNE